MKQQVKDANSTNKTVSKPRKILGIIANVIMWLFIAFAVVITIFAFSAQSSSDGIPTIAGKVMSPVLSESMAPTINKGDLIFSRKLAPEDKYNLTVGTIISFKQDLDGDGTPEVNTHRIISVTTTTGGFIEYKTKGDNNVIEDSYNVSASDVISVFEEGKDTRLPLLGGLINFLLQPTGFLVVIVLPLVLFFFFEIFMFVRKVIEIKNTGKKHITAEDEELIKQRAIEEYIRSQQQAAANGHQPTPEKKPEEPAEDAESDDAGSGDEGSGDAGSGDAGSGNAGSDKE